MFDIDRQRHAEYIRHRYRGRIDRQIEEPQIDYSAQLDRGRLFSSQIDTGAVQTDSSAAIDRQIRRRQIAPRMITTQTDRRTIFQPASEADRSIVRDLAVRSFACPVASSNGIREQDWKFSWGEGSLILYNRLFVFSISIEA